MRTWIPLLAGLLVWAIHFFLLYGVGEFGGEGGTARVSVLLLTVLALAVLAFLAARMRHAAWDEGFPRWRSSIALGGLGIGAIAVVWQALPALLA